MNLALESYASSIGLRQPGNEGLRLAFASACAGRVRHLLEEPAVEACLAVLTGYLDGTASRDALDASATEAAQLATSHLGSKSIDGCGHAAVSATYAVARALQGKALECASYAAYAVVYAQGGSAAVADRGSFDAEFAWQVATLKSLADAMAKQVATTAG